MKCICLHSSGIEKVQCLCTMYTVHSPIAWYFESSFHSAIFPLDLNIFKKPVHTQKSSRTSYIFPCMSSKYTLPFLPFAFHWTILCCLVTLACSPVNLVSQGVFHYWRWYLKLVLRGSSKKVSRMRMWWTVWRNIFLLFEKKTPENTLRCHDLYIQTVEWQA